MEENNNEELGTINPLVDPFLLPTKAFFEELKSVGDVWSDTVSDSFRYEVTEYSEEVVREYLEALISIYNAYETIVAEAENLTSPTAGMGGWLSLLDISMIAERGVSRLFFNRDDHRF
ncbi:MAG: hypothetical protein KGV46_03190 [Pasteurella sp.]|nr:hypothetical protein [Pasteurella sp.]